MRGSLDGVSNSPTARIPVPTAVKSSPLPVAPPITFSPAYQAPALPWQLRFVQSLSCVRFFATPWTAARQASPSITNSRSLLKLMDSLFMSIHHVHGCYPTISSFVVPFSSRLQSFPASGSFPLSQWPTAGCVKFQLCPVLLKASPQQGATFIVPTHLEEPWWFPRV